MKFFLNFNDNQKNDITFLVYGNLTTNALYMDIYPEEFHF